MLIHNKLEKIGAVFILLSFFLHIFVFVYTQRKKAEGASFCHLKVCHPGLPRYTCTPRMRSQKKSFLCHDPSGQTPASLAQSLGTQQEQLSTASLFRSVLVVPCLRLVTLGASIQPWQPGPQSNNAGVFLGVCSCHVPAHSLTQWQTTMFSCLHPGIRQRRGLSSVHLTARYLILSWTSFFLQTWLLSARLCYFLRCYKGKPHRVTCMFGTAWSPVGWVF